MALNQALPSLFFAVLVSAFACGRGEPAPTPIPPATATAAAAAVSDAPAPTATPTQEPAEDDAPDTPTLTATATPTPTPTPEPAEDDGDDTPEPSPTPTETPAAEVVLDTPTPTPEPPATATLVRVPISGFKGVRLGFSMSNRYIGRQQGQYVLSRFVAGLPYPNSSAGWQMGHYRNGDRYGRTCLRYSPQAGQAKLGKAAAKHCLTVAPECCLEA